MAARLNFTTEQVIGELFSNDDSVAGSVDGIEEPELCTADKQEGAAERIRKCLGDLEMKTPAIKDRFLESAVELLVPLYNFSDSAATSNQFLDSMPIHAGSLFIDEGRLWLQAIYRRLSARRSVRTPYYAEVHRSIPRSIFSVLVRLVNNSDGFAPPFCVYNKNRKAEVISFTSIRLVKELFSLLSGLTESNVVTYFKRNLTGMRTGHRVTLIVDDCKDFSFIYKINKGELTISYHFGEWNTCGVLHY